MTLLPPNATKLERTIEESNGAALDAVPVPLRDLWNPATCPVALLPFLAWGVSIDFWDSDWTEAEKRAAIASAIQDQRRKGTRLSLRTVLDRFDPLIALVEWFEDRDTLAPHTFRLELPLPVDSAVAYDEALIDALMRDIAAVKPLRSHFTVVQKLVARANAFLLGGAHAGGFTRMNGFTDLTVPEDPIWATYLQTEQGEPLRGGEGDFLEVV